MKVYLIGHIPPNIEIIRAEMSLPINAEIICVEKIDDIPIQDRRMPQVESYKFTAPPNMPEIYMEDIDKHGNIRGKGRGHKTPYKYHK